MMNRVLVVGHGSIGQRHLRIVRQNLPQADIRVLRHRPGSGVSELANGVYHDLESACTFAPQVAIIANPAPFHLQTAAALVATGSHLLIEKPLSHDLEGVEALLQQARTQGVVLQVGYNLRFLPSLSRFRDLVQHGEIGHVLSVRCEIGQYLPTWRPDSDYRQGVSAQQALGGGVLLELSHELDYLRWIFGEVSWVKSYLGRHSQLEIDVEDLAHLVLGFSPNSACDASGPVAALSLDFLRHDPIRLCTAIGERGSLRWNGLTGTVERYMAGGDGWQLVCHQPHQRDDSYHSQWCHFLECVYANDNPLVSGEDGYAVLKIVTAARSVLTHCHLIS
ncbi:Gfo/Idh/MocA family protein [Cylindrospermopsis raciborskii UAM/DH-MRr]|uniref:Gfo/Idh/MocA family protein n=1 Tax=Cylindrospermopsis raciborskii TaxID=77022 RepID=UPI00387A6FFE